jgi:hypothetical protein
MLNGSFFLILYNPFRFVHRDHGADWYFRGPDSSIDVPPHRQDLSNKFGDRNRLQLIREIDSAYNNDDQPCGTAEKIIP